MNFSQPIVLSLVQGVTEFLPVSSSAHLVIVSHFLGYKQDFTLDVFLHTGTLLAVILYFRKSIRDFFNINIVLKILVASLPAGIIGVLFKKSIESVFENINFIPYFLLFTGVVLFLSGYITEHKKTIYDITIKDAFIIGIFQAVALLPGVSRSGTTIAGAMFLKIKKEDAAKFSFYMFLLAVSGATSLEGKDIILAQENSYVIYYLAGIFLSCIFGYSAIEILMKVLKKTNLRVFSWYCFALSILLLILKR